MAEIEYEIILVIFFTSVLHLNYTHCCFLYPRMGPLYLNSLYLHWERVLSTEATIVFYSSPDWTNQTPLSFYDN